MNTRTKHNKGAEESANASGRCPATRTIGLALRRSNVVPAQNRRMHYRLFNNAYLSILLRPSPLQNFMSKSNVTLID